MQTNAGKVMVLENFWLVVSSFSVGVILLLGTSIELANDLLLQYFGFQLNNGLRFAIILILSALWVASLFIIEKILFKEEQDCSQGYWLRYC